VEWQFKLPACAASCSRRAAPGLTDLKTHTCATNELFIVANSALVESRAAVVHSLLTVHAGRRYSVAASQAQIPYVFTGGASSSSQLAKVPRGLLNPEQLKAVQEIERNDRHVLCQKTLCCTELAAAALSCAAKIADVSEFFFGD